MTRDEAIARLKPFERALRDLGATSLFLFGSTARDEATDASDLDVFLDIDPASRFSLLDLIGAKQLLEDELGIKADVLTRKGLHPLMRTDIEHDAVRVF